MKGTFAVLVLVAVTGSALLGIGLYTATRPAPPPAASAAVPPTPPLAPLLSRPGVPSIEGALHDLDLIRPNTLRAADDFTVTLLDGRRFRLSEQRGKMVFVNFWATWCPPCRAEMPAMEKLYRKHQGDPFVMLAVSLDADPKVVPTFVKAHGFTFPVATDPRQEVGERYAVRALPSTFIVDPQGNLAALALGARAWDGTQSDALVKAMVASR